MNFQEALARVCDRAEERELSDPFFVYSYLSDLCGADYADKQDIAVLYEFDSRYLILRTLLKYGESGKKKLMRAFRAERNRITADDFRFVVDFVADAMRGDFC